jgi:hypothetical protein
MIEQWTQNRGVSVCLVLLVTDHQRPFKRSMIHVQHIPASKVTTFQALKQIICLKNVG